MFWSKQRALVAAGARLLRLPRSDYSSIPDLVGLNLVRSVDKSIDSNSSIFVESPIHVRVVPLDYSTTAQDKLVMQLYSREKSPGDFNVKQTSKRLELINTASPTERNDVCVLHVPLHLNVHVIATAQANVDISQILGNEVVVKTEKGGVHIKDVRAHSIKVESVEGPVKSSGRLEAERIDLKTGLASGIHCNNIMSNTAKLTTHAGPIAVESCYSDTSHFTTALGDIRLQHVQCVCAIDIIQKGNLIVGGLEGSLQASLKSGDVFILASKLTDKSSIFIHEKGHVEMKLVELLKHLTVNLIGGKVDVEDEIKKLGRYMDDSHPQRFRYPLDEDENNQKSELTVECRNGIIELKKSDVPFMLKNS